jgi:hypothetical protein
MEDLPREMIDEILVRLDRPSLFQASNVCKLWRRQAVTHVIAINDEFQLATAARNGDRLSIIKSVCNNRLINYGLGGACQGGHEDLANLMIAKGAWDFDCGLYGACEIGHLNLAKLMITKGATAFWLGLEIARLGGYKDLIELITTKDAEFSSRYVKRSRNH